MIKQSKVSVVFFWTEFYNKRSNFTREFAKITLLSTPFSHNILTQTAQEKPAAFMMYGNVVEI